MFVVTLVCVMYCYCYNGFVHLYCRIILCENITGHYRFWPPGSSALRSKLQQTPTYSHSLCSHSLIINTNQTYSAVYTMVSLFERSLFLLLLPPTFRGFLPVVSLYLKVIIQYWCLINSSFFMTVPVSRDPWETRGQIRTKNKTKHKEIPRPKTVQWQFTIFTSLLNHPSDRQNDLNHHCFVLVWPSLWKYTIQPLKSTHTKDSAPHSPALLAVHPLTFTFLLLDKLIPSGTLLWPGRGYLHSHQVNVCFSLARHEYHAWFVDMSVITVSAADRPGSDREPVPLKSVI